MNFKSILLGDKDANSIKPKAAPKEFEMRVTKEGLQIQQLTLNEGIRLMFEFYREMRADKCPLDEDGDMLLFEWGTWNFVNPRRFQIALTRQFIRPSGEDEDISQLRLLFRFDPSTESEALADGNRWCHTPDGLAEFERFVRESGPYRLYGDRQADELVFHYQDGV
jgi:hypothetical protein